MKKTAPSTLKKLHEALKRFRRDRGGAVYVEFLAVFLPLFMFFLALVQLIFVHAANLIVKHAAGVAVRQAVVVLPDDPKFYGGTGVNVKGGARLEAIEKAAAFPLSPIGGAGGIADLNIEGGNDRDDLVTVTLEFNYPCRVPGGSWLVCGGATKTLAAQASLPNQGVEFTY